MASRCGVDEKHGAVGFGPNRPEGTEGSAPFIAADPLVSSKPLSP